MRAQRTFRIASPDLFDLLFLPRLVERLQSRAPGVNLDVAPFATGSIEERLAAGELDLAVVPVMASPSPDAREGLVRRTLFHDGFRCFLRAGHPALSRSWTVATWSELRHLLVAPGGRPGGVVDELLERHGLRRRVGLLVRNFSTAPRLVAHTDLVLTAPAAMAKITRQLNIVDRDPPLAIAPVGVALLWHRRFAQEPDHIWLREQLVEVTRRAGLD